MQLKARLYSSGPVSLLISDHIALDISTRKLATRANYRLPLNVTFFC